MNIETRTYPDEIWHCGRGCEHPDVCMVIKAAAGGTCEGSHGAKAAALLCPSSGIGSSNVLRVVNVLAQIRGERLHLEAYYLALQGVQSVT